MSSFPPARKVVVCGRGCAALPHKVGQPLTSGAFHTSSLRREVSVYRPIKRRSLAARYTRRLSDTRGVCECVRSHCRTCFVWAARKGLPSAHSGSPLQRNRARRLTSHNWAKRCSSGDMSPSAGVATRGVCAPPTSRRLRSKTPALGTAWNAFAASPCSALSLSPSEEPMPVG